MSHKSPLSLPIELTVHLFAPLPLCSADVSARRSTSYAQTQSSLGNLSNHPYPYPTLTRSAPASFIVTLTQPLPGTPTPVGIGMGVGMGMGSCSGSSRSSRNNKYDISDLPVYPKPAPPLSKVSSVNLDVTPATSVTSFLLIDTKLILFSKNLNILFPFLSLSFHFCLFCFHHFLTFSIVPSFPFSASSLPLSPSLSLHTGVHPRSPVTGHRILL